MSTKKPTKKTTKKPVKVKKPVRVVKKVVKAKEVVVGTVEAPEMPTAVSVPPRNYIEAKDLRKSGNYFELPAHAEGFYVHQNSDIFLRVRPFKRAIRYQVKESIEPKKIEIENNAVLFRVSRSGGQFNEASVFRYKEGKDDIHLLHTNIPNVRTNGTICYGQKSYFGTILYLYNTFWNGLFSTSIPLRGVSQCYGATCQGVKKHQCRFGNGTLQYHNHNHNKDKECACCVSLLKNRGNEICGCKCTCGCCRGHYCNCQCSCDTSPQMAKYIEGVFSQDFNPGDYEIISKNNMVYYPNSGGLFIFKDSKLLTEEVRKKNPNLTFPAKCRNGKIVVKIDETTFIKES